MLTLPQVEYHNDSLLRNFRVTSISSIGSWITSLNNFLVQKRNSLMDQYEAPTALPGFDDEVSLIVTLLRACYVRSCDTLAI